MLLASILFRKCKSVEARLISEYTSLGYNELATHIFSFCFFETHLTDFPTLGVDCHHYPNLSERVHGDDRRTGCYDLSVVMGGW